MKQVLVLIAVLSALCHPAADKSPRKTNLSIVGEDFHINGQPTYAGRCWQGQRVEGLLLNARMVQATFDDLNPQTAVRWAYADTGKWDAERNVSEFIAAMPEWKRHGLLAVTVNFQGGSEQGRSTVSCGDCRQPDRGDSDPTRQPHNGRPAAPLEAASVELTCSFSSSGSRRLAAAQLPAPDVMQALKRSGD